MYYRKNKILEPLEALKILTNKQNVIFVSGVFDIFHIGHLTFLRQAKNILKKKGILLVVVHDDKSVRAKKGQNRPINELKYRIEMLSELECVDFVVPWYGWENVREFVIALKPGYIAVTEGQFENKTIKNFSIKNEIKLKVIKMSVDISTSKLIKAIGSEL